MAAEAHLLDQLVGDGVQGQHHLDGGAALPRVAVAALHHILGRQANVRILRRMQNTALYTRPVP